MVKTVFTSHPYREEILLTALPAVKEKFAHGLS